jgi:hypothetical protein
MLNAQDLAFLDESRDAVEILSTAYITRSLKKKVENR